MDTLIGLYALNLFLGIPIAVANDWKYWWVLSVPIGLPLLASIYFIKNQN